MGTIDFEFGTLIHGRQNSMGVFDADLNPDVRNATTNADLTLYLRICFQKIDRTDAQPTYAEWGGRQVPIEVWRPNEYESFKRRFIADCQQKWSGKFWLQTPATYNGLNWPDLNPTHRCNLYCRMEMEEQSSTQGAHAVIPVVKVARSTNFRSHMLLYSSNDLRSENLTRGSNFFTHVHEIGHLIGLDHVGASNAGCVNGGEAVCYAAPDGTDTGIMGRGSRPEVSQAQPWIRAASVLTGVAANQWTVSLRRVYPVPLVRRA